jgi:hypothetical protein
MFILLVRLKKRFGQWWQKKVMVDFERNNIQG